MSKIRMGVAVGMTALLASCSENTATPVQQVQSTQPTVGDATAALTTTDTIRFSITIDPKHTTSYNLGSGNSLTFPAHSLCDLNSPYGPDQWDQPCREAKGPLTVNTKAWLDSQGHARVDFDKHVRFVPSNNPSQWVVIQFADLQASLDPFFNILYCPTATSGCYDESTTDPSLLTVRDPITGRVTRRIKHFSGYNVAAGDDAGETSVFNMTVGGYSLSFTAKDLELDDVDAIGAAYPVLTPQQRQIMLDNIRYARRRFSGYILASG
jgi:hypothetical protein